MMLWRMTCTTRVSDACAAGSQCEIRKHGLKEGNEKENKLLRLDTNGMSGESKLGFPGKCRGSKYAVWEKRESR